MTDDKPYRSVIQAGRSPFQPARSELVEELKMLLAYRPTGLDDLNLGLDLTERLAIEKAMKARACELLRQLYPFRPTTADWEREDAVLGHDFFGRTIYKGARVGVRLGDWLPAVAIDLRKGGLSRGLIMVRVDGRETIEDMEPRNIIVDHPCTKAREDARDPVHEPPPSGEEGEAWFCAKCGHPEATKLTRCSHCGHERGSAEAPELLGHDAVGLPIHRDVRVEAIDLDPPAFARAIGSRDKWLTVVFDDHEVSDSIEMSRVRVLVPTEEEQLREAQRRLAQLSAVARRSRRTLRMQEFARDILDLGSRTDLLDGPQHVLHKVLERALLLAELVLEERNA